MFLSGDTFFFQFNFNQTVAAERFLVGLDLCSHCSHFLNSHHSTIQPCCQGGAPWSHKVVLQFHVVAFSRSSWVEGWYSCAVHQKYNKCYDLLLSCSVLSVTEFFLECAAEQNRNNLTFIHCGWILIFKIKDWGQFCSTILPRVRKIWID